MLGYRQCTRCRYIESAKSGTLFQGCKFSVLKAFYIVYYVSTKAEANVRTDQWVGYKGLEKEFPHIVREKSEKKGKNFAELHRCIMMFKAWLRGVHHSVKHLQSYLDEYTYRFNRHTMKEGIFENLLTRMIENPPYTYKMIIN